MADLGAHIDVGAPIPIPAPPAVHSIPAEVLGIEDAVVYWYIVVVGRDPGVYFGPLSTRFINN